MAAEQATGVWITAESAQIVRWSPGTVLRHRIESAVPGRHRSTGGPPSGDQASGGGHDDEHLRAFFAQIIHVLSVEDALLLIGDGEVVGHFATFVRADDARHGRSRRVEVLRSGPLTERQLIARVRAFAGSPVRRRRQPPTGAAPRS